MRDDEALVTVAVFDTAFEASVARGALEAIGIAALVPEEMQIRTRGEIFSTAQLQVFESDLPSAATELRRMQIRCVDASSDAE
jgi:hypothetical protein